MRLRPLLASICLILISGPLFARAEADEASSNWPSFRGPLHTGVAPEATPPVNWSESQNVNWKVELPGEGSGSPIVWGDRIYLLTAIKTDRTADSPPKTATSDSAKPIRVASNGDRVVVKAVPPSESAPEGAGGTDAIEPPTNYYQFVVMCLDRNAGRTIWRRLATEVIPHEGHHPTSSFASSTPVTDGKNIYVSFGSRGIYSYDMDGQLRWKRSLGKMNIKNSFGEGSSPALHGDTLVVNWDHMGDCFIVALDANTGEEKWRTPRPGEPTTWNTPLIVRHDGQTQVIVNGINRARGYDLETGEVIWECGGQAAAAIPTVAVHEGLAFCMTGYEGSALYAIPLSSRGDITDTAKVAWKLDRDTPYVPSPMIYDDRLYFLKSHNGILSCYRAATGKAVYRTKRVPELDVVYASPVGAAGRIYISGRNGTTAVVKHGSEFDVLATNHLDEAITATPALVGDEIIIRGEKSLYRITE